MGVVSGVLGRRGLCWCVYGAMLSWEAVGSCSYCVGFGGGGA